MRIVIPDDFTNTFGGSTEVERLRRMGELTIFTSTVPDEQEAVRRLQEAEIVLANRERTPFTRNVLQSLPKLRLLSVTGPFFNNVDFQAATELGIVVTRTASSAPRAVAELVFGLAIALFRRIPRGDAAIRRGEWPTVPGAQLSGKTLGIIGVGNVGTVVAGIAPAFQMTTLAWGPVASDRAQAEATGAKYVELDELLRSSDVVTLHVRLSQLTEGLIGEREIALMKPRAVLINAARAAIVDEKALVRALQERWIAGAALDVFMEEPLPASSPLVALDNVVLSPHIGFVTNEVAELQARWAVDNVEAYLAGTKPDVANPEVWEGRRR